MAARPFLTRYPELAIGLGLAVVSAAAAVAFLRWTFLLVPVVWAAIAWLTSVSLPQAFASLAAATVLLPLYPLRYGVSLDDLIPSAAAIAGVVLLARWKPPRLPRLVEAAFGVWLIAAAVSAAVNGDGAEGIARLAAPGVGRPVFWLVFTWTAYAIARRGGMRMLLIPIAAIAVLEALLTVAAYAGCTEIHLGEVSHPDNESVWETRRPLGVERGAGTNVGEQRIRCRATGTLGQSSNFLAAFAVTTLPVAAGVAIAHKGSGRRWWWAAGSLVMAVTLVLTFTRAALIAAALGLIVTLLFAAPRRAVPAILAAAVLLAAATLAVPQLRRRLSDPANDRRALWYSGMLIFVDHPLAGVGFGNYRAVQESDERYLDTPYGRPTTTAHNGFIAIAAEGGAFQAAAVLVLAGGIVVYGWRASRRTRGSPEGALIAGALGGVAGFLVQNMTNTLLLVPAVATYFWVLGGGLAGAAAASQALASPRKDRAQVAAE